MPQYRLIIEERYDDKKELNNLIFTTDVFLKSEHDIYKLTDIVQEKYKPSQESTLKLFGVSIPLKCEYMTWNNKNYPLIPLISHNKEKFKQIGYVLLGFGLKVFFKIYKVDDGVASLIDYKPALDRLSPVIIDNIE